MDRPSAEGSGRLTNSSREEIIVVEAVRIEPIRRFADRRRNHAKQSERAR